MTNKETVRYLENGMEMITEGTYSNTPYMDKLFERPNKIRMGSQT